MMQISKDGRTFTLRLEKSWRTARNFGNWDTIKYKNDMGGTTIPISVIQNEKIRTCILIFPEDGIHVKAPMDKVREYMKDTPQAQTFKHEAEQMIVPLSIFEQVEDDIDMNQL